MKLNNNYLYKIITLSSAVFLLNNCVSKNSDGRYNSNYSYHPYNLPSQTDSSFQNALGDAIEKTAKPMLGIAYKYGANGPDYYDCSSFTQYVFSRQGIKIPRVSREQAKVGAIIHREGLQKGDLIFFDSKSSSKVSHVGIYLDKGMFIHASSAKKGVTISNLNSNYYKKHFKWGRRLSRMNRYTRR